MLTVCLCRKNKAHSLNDRDCSPAARFTGRTLHNVINMGSYNYLGFAENEAASLKTVADTTLQYGLGVCSTRHEIGAFMCSRFPGFLIEFVLFGCEYSSLSVHPLQVPGANQGETPAHTRPRESLEFLHICLFTHVAKKRKGSTSEEQEAEAADGVMQTHGAHTKASRSPGSVGRFWHQLSDLSELEELVVEKHFFLFH